VILEVPPPIIKLRKRKYSFKRGLSLKSKVFILGGRPPKPLKEKRK
jgi:hypothetical protein